jgi:cobalamin synthase
MLGMTILPDPRSVKLENLGLPEWAWPVIGLVAGAALVVVIHGTCFVEPQKV